MSSSNYLEFGESTEWNLVSTTVLDSTAHGAAFIPRT